jgi:hypothetical protein
VDLQSAPYKPASQKSFSKLKNHLISLDCKSGKGKRGGLPLSSAALLVKEIHADGPGILELRTTLMPPA